MIAHETRRPQDADLAALYRHGVLVVRGFDPDDDAFLAFASGFGEPEPVFPASHALPGCPCVRLQSNVGGFGASAGGRYWHADGPLKPRPTAVTVLRCVEPPDSDGDTLFADMGAAFDDLPADVRDRAATARGSFPARDIARRDMDRARMMRTAVITDEERDVKLAELTNLTHPLARPHPVTGRRALYLNEHWLSSVEGMEPDRGRELLDTLYAVATREANVHRHVWAAGDVVVWDNARVMHRAEPAGGRKVTHRVTTADYRPARSVSAQSASSWSRR